MTFKEKIQQPIFWKNVAKITVPFFVIVVLISLLWNSSGAIFSGDFAKVNELNFTDGKWKNFWASKILISFFYGIYVTNKKTK
jgi:hypothetical protein